MHHVGLEESRYVSGHHGCFHVMFSRSPLSPPLRLVSIYFIQGGIFDAEFSELFPDLPTSDKPETTLAMHQSPDKSMYWISGQEGLLVKVRIRRFIVKMSLNGVRLRAPRLA